MSNTFTVDQAGLEALSVKQLLAIAKSCGGIGFDPFKDDRTKHKPGLVSFMLAKFTAGSIAAAYSHLHNAPALIPDVAPLSPVAPAPHQEPAAMNTPIAPIAPIAPTDTNAIMQQMASLFATLAGSAVNEQTVRGIVDKSVEEAMKSQAPRVIEVRLPEREPVQLAGRQHPMFDKVLKLAAAGVNVMLVGPAGCGKTHLAHQVAKALGLEFSSISGSAGASESQLLGRLLPTGDGGRFEYHESPFVRTYENGGCFLFDEIDAFDPNMLLVVNQATANGGFTVEARTERQFVARHEKTVMLASANTWGTGASAMYVGRSQLDAATLDRYYIIPMDYDRDFEAEIAPANLVTWVHGVREKAQAAGLRRVVSTRMIQKGAAALAAGLPISTVKADLLAGWSKDELAKVGA